MTEELLNAKKEYDDYKKKIASMYFKKNDMRVEIDNVKEQFAIDFIKKVESLGNLKPFEIKHSVDIEKYDSKRWDYNRLELNFPDWYHQIHIDFKQNDGIAITISRIEIDSNKVMDGVEAVLQYGYTIATHKEELLDFRKKFDFSIIDKYIEFDKEIDKTSFEEYKYQTRYEDLLFNETVVKGTIFKNVNIDNGLGDYFVIDTVNKKSVSYHNLKVGDDGSPVAFENYTSLKTDINFLKKLLIEKKEIEVFNYETL